MQVYITENNANVLAKHDTKNQNDIQQQATPSTEMLNKLKNEVELFTRTRGIPIQCSTEIEIG